MNGETKLIHIETNTIDVLCQVLRSLKYQDDGIVQEELDVTDKRVPLSLADLETDMREIGIGGAVIPEYLETQLTELSKTTRAHGPFRPDMFGKDKKRYPSDLHREFKLGHLIQLVDTARACNRHDDDESHWNNHVHTLLLTLVFYGTNFSADQIDGFMSCTSASILAEHKVNASQDKKVDYACHLNPEKDDQLPNAREIIGKRFKGLTDNAINHTGYRHLQDRPISFSIETKRGQKAQKAQLQRGIIWTAFASFGSTATLLSAFQIMAGVQRLRIWPWYEKFVLNPEPAPATSEERP
ncbi:hypothetical protein IL306_013699 [Fusarium sp. DS 682]|nr:hypothetical protein IL306_013699 [Fusarium sp. DS 682]